MNRLFTENRWVLYSDDAIKDGELVRARVYLRQTRAGNWLSVSNPAEATFYKSESAVQSARVDFFAWAHVYKESAAIDLGVFDILRGFLRIGELTLGFDWQGDKE